MNIKRYFQQTVCEKKIGMVMRGSPEDTTEPFKTNMMRFIDHAVVEIKEQENNLIEAKKR